MLACTLLSPLVHAQLPAGWPADARAQPDVFVAFDLPPFDLPQQDLVWPRRVQPADHSAPWFHAVQTITSDIPFAAPGQFFAGEGDNEVLSMRAQRDAERLARALGIAQEDIAATILNTVPQTRGAFLVSIRSPDKAVKLRPQERRDASTAMRLVSAREEDNKWLIEHAAFFVYEPLSKPTRDANKPAEVAPPKGIILLMPGLLATPEGTLDGLARRLRRNNWIVLRLIAQPSRFIEETPMAIDVDTQEQSVQSIARVLDERMADCAYVVAGAFAELATQRPALAKLPRIAIGFSGGAITLPTVVALQPELYKGAVLIGGGSNFFQMIDTSNYTSFLGGTGPTWPDVEPAALATLKLDTYTSYLKHAKLDAFNTADSLKDIPTLMIYGSADKAVPSPLADQLWHRLGRKQREVYDVGHEVLFAQLPSRFDAIVAWCNAVVEGKDPAAIPQAAGYIAPETMPTESTEPVLPEPASPEPASPEPALPEPTTSPSQLP